MNTNEKHKGNDSVREATVRGSEEKSKCPVMLKKRQSSAQTQFPPPDFCVFSPFFVDSGFAV